MAEDSHPSPTVDFWKQLNQLEQVLRANSTIEVLSFDLQKPDRKPAQVRSTLRRSRLRLDESVHAFYAQVGSVRLEWRSPNHDADVAGKANILPLNRVLKDWKDDIYFEDDSVQDPRRFFHPIDFFAPEAAAGILITERPDPQVYLFTYHDDPIPLGVDLTGYVALLIEARGFLYWQKHIVSMLKGVDSEESRRFQEKMPEVFPGFQTEMIAKRHRKLRLKKES